MVSLYFAEQMLSDSSAIPQIGCREIFFVPLLGGFEIIGLFCDVSMFPSEASE